MLGELEGAWMCDEPRVAPVPCQFASDYVLLSCSTCTFASHNVSAISGGCSRSCEVNSTTNSLDEPPLPEPRMFESETPVED